MIAASFALKANQGSLPIPRAERHIRALYDRLADRQGYTDDDRLAVWRDVIEQGNGHITGRHVDEAINRYLKMREIDHITLSDWRDLTAAEGGGVKPRSFETPQWQSVGFLRVTLAWCG